MLMNSCDSNPEIIRQVYRTRMPGDVSFPRPARNTAIACLFVPVFELRIPVRATPFRRQVQH
jgi:hypothetical protein